MNTVVSDWTHSNGLKYRRIGATMEIVILKTSFEEPKEEHLLCDIPHGLEGHEITLPESIKKFHRDVIFLGQIIPDHWSIHTRRQFRIDGWENNFVISEDTGE